jgi:aerobic carbon-monoxide dehydrogenase medium subunit
VKPAPFVYRRAGSISEAIGLLAEWEGEAKLLAGGQSLMPMMNMRLVRPACLVDINGVAGLDDIREDDGQIAVGALTRYSTIEWSPTIGARLPLLAELVRYVGDRQIRTRGTIGGSLAHADPTGEMPLASLVLDASLRVQGGSGSRVIGASEFFQGSYATALESDEVVTEVVFPFEPEPIGAFAECTRRHGDFAIMSVAALGVPGDGDTWDSVRIALGGVADTSFVAEGASALATGTSLEAEVVQAIGVACTEAADPHSDVRASAEYRRHLIPIYVERVLDQLRRRRSGGRG